MSLSQHPLSAAFPSMPEAELEGLVEDIRKHGQREPGLLLDGMVLDGWHRYLACKKAGVGFDADDFDGDDPVAFVLSKNLHRRHLTGSQRAACIVAATNWRPNGVRYSPAPGAGVTSADMAKQAEVGERTIRQAKAAHDAGLGDAVKEGQISAKRAAEVAKLPPAKRAQALKQKPAKPPKPETVPLAKYQALEKKHATLIEKYDELLEELETYNSVKNGDAAKDMLTLRQLLAQANRARDDAMRTSSQMRTQINQLTRELKKFGWKGFKKK